MVTSSSICLEHDVKIIEASREMVMQHFILKEFSLTEGIRKTSYLSYPFSMTRKKIDFFRQGGPKVPGTNKATGFYILYRVEATKNTRLPCPFLAGFMCLLNFYCVRQQK